RFRKSELSVPAPSPAGETVSIQALRDHLPDAAASNWAGSADRIAVLRKHLRGKAASAMAAAAAVDFGPLDLAGPTGEANTLLLAPCGLVLCLGPDDETLLAQTVQALAAGNPVLAVASHARTALAPLIGKGLPLEVLVG